MTTLEQTAEHPARSLAAAALVLAIGMGGGAGLRRWLAASHRHRPRFDTAAAARSPFAAAGFNADAAALWNRLLGVLGLPDARRLTFDKLVAILLGHRHDAIAAKFAKQFMADPKLAALWTECARHGCGAEAQARLLRALSGDPNFIAMLNAAVVDPAFRETADGVAREASAVIVQGGAAGVTGTKDLASGKDFAVGRGVAAGTSASASIRPDRGAGAWGTFGPHGPAATGQGSDTGVAGRGFSNGTGGNADAEGDGGDTRTASGAGHGDDVTTKGLGPVEAAGNSGDAVSALASLCYRHDPSITQAQCGAIKNLLGQNDLWTSCQLSNNLGVCENICLTHPAARCTEQARNIQNCMIAGAAAAACTANCAAHADCAGPPPPPPCNDFLVKAGKPCLPPCNDDLMEAGVACVPPSEPVDPNPIHICAGRGGIWNGFDCIIGGPLTPQITTCVATGGVWTADGCMTGNSNTQPGHTNTTSQWTEANWNSSLGTTGPGQQAVNPGPVTTGNGPGAITPQPVTAPPPPTIEVPKNGKCSSGWTLNSNGYCYPPGNSNGQPSDSTDRDHIGGNDSGDGEGW